LQIPPPVIDLPGFHFQIGQRLSSGIDAGWRGRFRPFGWLVGLRFVRFARTRNCRFP
jgi:hypothetical protein